MAAADQCEAPADPRALIGPERTAHGADSPPGRVRQYQLQAQQGQGHATGHPIIKSFEPGEDWGWCYVDEVMLDGSAW